MARRFHSARHDTVTACLIPRSFVSDNMISLKQRQDKSTQCWRFNNSLCKPFFVVIWIVVTYSNTYWVDTDVEESPSASILRRQ